ncbi:MAG: UbiA family prenyltransferase [Fibrobacteres bacterium]|nr:UbiA family prenyltransferase [Fibrobacterota bacterium]
MKILDAFFVMRPLILIPVWGYFLLGYYSAVKNYSNVDSFAFIWTFSPLTWLTLSLLLMSVASAYVLNQLNDIEADKKNGGLPLIAAGKFPASVAKIETLLLAILPLIISAFIAPQVFFLITLATLLNAAYNLRPLYFTGRPFADFLSNAIGFGFVAFGLGWISAHNMTLPSIWNMTASSMPYFLFMAAGSINSTIPDRFGDKEAGKITTVVFLGEKKANLISILFLLSALTAAVINEDRLAILTASISIPLFIKYQITSKESDALRTFQVGGALLIILIAIFVPVFCISGIAIFFATRLYFKKRFGVKYP